MSVSRVISLIKRSDICILSGNSYLSNVAPELALKQVESGMVHTLEGHMLLMKCPDTLTSWRTFGLLTLTVPVAGCQP